MAKTTKTTTGALDASAMFQAGAAGTATTKTSKEKGASGFFKQIGTFALSYYMRSKENLRAARTEESNIFATVKAQALDSGLVSRCINPPFLPLSLIKGYIFLFNPSYIFEINSPNDIFMPSAAADISFKNSVCPIAPDT